MSLFWHVLETGLLILAAYLGGCILGYSARRLQHAAKHRPVRATAKVLTDPAPAATPATTGHPVPASQPIAEPEPERRRPAARLAAAVPDEVIPDRPVVKLTAESSPSPEPEPRPEALAAPRHGTADNLRLIRGIGPKIEASLHEMGIFHLDQIAAWSPDNVGWVEARLAFRGRVTREAWVEQARALLSAAV